MNTMQARQHQIAPDQQHDVLYKKLVSEAGRLFSLAEEQPEQLTESLRLCLTALDINPNGLQALNLCARINLQLGELIQAEHWIARALQLKPDSVSALYSAVTLLLLPTIYTQPKNVLKQLAKFLESQHVLHHPLPTFI